MTPEAPNRLKADGFARLAVCAPLPASTSAPPLVMLTASTLPYENASIDGTYSSCSWTSKQAAPQPRRL